MSNVQLATGVNLACAGIHRLTGFVVPNMALAAIIFSVDCCVIARRTGVVTKTTSM
tara:strand:- start:2113 stop:2280 length:168 start_codon:yes stop_codon:yes gene_type:complete